MRYFLRLSYNGTNFHGWQIQPNAISVQQVLEESLSTIFRREIDITGAGRTDTGVHAAEMYAHFDIDFPINEKEKKVVSLNRLIGKDISIYDILEVEDDAHARFDAVSRTYKYFITYQKNPFLYPFSFFSHRKFDIDKMNEACEILKSTSDFTSFAKLHSDNKTNICKVSMAKWDIMDFGKSDSYPSIPFSGIVFTITADRFLRNMVRAIVGTLVEVGCGKITLKDFSEIIDSQDRCAAGNSMPAEGLFLWKIKYPYL